MIFDDLDEPLKSLNEKNIELQMRLIAISGDKTAEKVLEEQNDDLREEKQAILSKVAERTDLKNRMNDMITYLDEKPELLTEYSDTITIKIV